MKKTFRRILIFAIVATLIIPAFTVSSFAWTTEGHYTLQRNSAKKMIRENGNLNFSSNDSVLNGASPGSATNKNELSLMLLSCRLADVDGYACRALTGRGNYVGTVKFLNELAYSYLNGGTATNTASANRTYIDNFYAAFLARGNDPAFTSGDNGTYALLRESIVKLLTTKVHLDLTYESSNRKRAIKVFGFACHVAGDMYAHQTVVHPSMVDSMNTCLVARNVTTLTAAEKTFLKTMLEQVNGNTDLVVCADLNKLEAHDFLSSYNLATRTNISNKLISTHIEDNISFHSNRYDESQIKSNTLMREMNSRLGITKTRSLTAAELKFDVTQRLPNSSRYEDGIHKLRSFDYLKSQVQN